MFDLEIWRADILQRLRRFVRAPQTEMGIYGTERLTYYLTSLVLEPFFQAFGNQPLRAVVTLANITQTAGTNFLIHNASTLRYSQQLLWSEFEHSPSLRLVIEQILLKLNVIEHLLHTLDDPEAHWLRQSLSDEIRLSPQWRINRIAPCAQRSAMANPLQHRSLASHPPRPLHWQRLAIN